jgi:hypothetical protein
MAVAAASTNAFASDFAEDLPPAKISAPLRNKASATRENKAILFILISTPLILSDFVGRPLNKVEERRLSHLVKSLISNYGVPGDFLRIVTISRALVPYKGPTARAPASGSISSIESFQQVTACNSF